MREIVKLFASIGSLVHNSYETSFLNQVLHLVVSFNELAIITMDVTLVQLMFHAQSTEENVICDNRY